PRDSLDVRPVQQQADRTLQADRVLAGQAAAPGPFPDEQRQRPVRRRLLRHIHARTREEDDRELPPRRRKGPPPVLGALLLASSPPPHPLLLSRRSGPLPDDGRERSRHCGAPRAVQSALPAASDRSGLAG